LKTSTGRSLEVFKRLSQVSLSANLKKVFAIAKFPLIN